MSSVVKQLKTKAALECEAKLAEFIRYCREDLTWVNDDPDFDWRSPEWRGVRWTKATTRKNGIFDESKQPILRTEFRPPCQ